MANRHLSEVAMHIDEALGALDRARGAGEIDSRAHERAADLFEDIIEGLAEAAAARGGVRRIRS